MNGGSSGTLYRREHGGGCTAFWGAAPLFSVWFFCRFEWFLETFLADGQYRAGSGSWFLQHLLLPPVLILSLLMIHWMLLQMLVALVMVLGRRLLRFEI
jgi:hypothetical protein